MKYQVVVDSKPGSFKVTLSGVFDLKDLENCYKEIIGNPSWKPGLDILWDSRECDLSDLDYNKISLIAKMTNKFKEQRGKGRAAWVVSRQVDYGISRMFHGISSDEVVFTFRVFNEMSEAERYLSSSRSLSENSESTAKLKESAQKSGTFR